VIAIDTSALIAIAAGEPKGRKCAVKLSGEVAIVSAGTMTEALIVANARGISVALNLLLERPNIEIVQVTAASARRAADAYAKWGKGVHRAKLNFGDCFAYELAMSRACPLLFIGNDFSKTDVKSAL
jgi:ribonuclease VapC